MRACYLAALAVLTALVAILPPVAAAQTGGPAVDLVTRRAGGPASGGAADQVRLDVYVAVPHTALQFLARGDAFEARYAVTAQVYRAGDDGDLGAAVASRTAAREVAAPNYGATQNPAVEDRAVLPVGLAPGRYLVRVTVEDGASGRTATTEEVHTVRPLTRGAVAVSDLLLLRAAPGTPASEPVVGATIPTDAGSFWASFEVYSAARRDLQVTTVVTERGGSRERPSFGALLGLAPRRAADYGVAVTTALAVGAGRTEAAVEIDADSLDVGDYTLTLRLETLRGDLLAETAKPFAVRWTGLEGQIADVDRAIDQLRHVAGSDVIAAIRRAATPAERYKRFLAFWDRRDPSPGTLRNERMEEYYGRVASANRRYSRGRVSGWNTDFGEVYIQFGEPDEVQERGSNYGTRPYQVWRYYELGRQFIFTDPTGSGDFRLAIPTWDERTRM
ncbi:GWxTD domain-containing protein [Rubrivirga litoralis]|uniref:GWxTD domain-containing protein n=1 Tax=Rubrivirga litoralis TaxID=3075598 RepID=A0ABU3BSQ1_9BACT|nr:GWxTD domain-containing protein [Rubrivirga sp. F394]MDT0632317.1 GWxTD domain-containing protein [Rubrivirga sp. F394]